MIVHISFKGRKTKVYIYIYIYFKVQGENTYLVPTFWANSDFGLYLILLLFQSLKTENQFYFGPYRQPINEKLLCDKRNDYVSIPPI